MDNQHDRNSRVDSGDVTSRRSNDVTLRLSNTQVIILASVIAVSVSSLITQLSSLHASAVTSQLAGDRAPAAADTRPHNTEDESQLITKKEFDGFVRYVREEFKILQIEYTNMAQSSVTQIEQSAATLKKLEIHGGATYTSWGTHICGENSQLIYTGIAIDEKSGYYCLPQTDGHRQQVPDKSTDDEDREQSANSTVNCVECLAVKRPALIVIPNTDSCPKRWNKEYSGYYTTAENRKPSEKPYECIHQSVKLTDIGRFIPIKADCVISSGSCPLLECVVCTL